MSVHLDIYFVCLSVHPSGSFVFYGWQPNACKHLSWFFVYGFLTYYRADMKTPVARTKAWHLARRRWWWWWWEQFGTINKKVCVYIHVLKLTPFNNIWVKWWQRCWWWWRWRWWWLWYEDDKADTLTAFHVRYTLTDGSFIRPLPFFYTKLYLFRFICIFLAYNKQSSEQDSLRIVIA